MRPIDRAVGATLTACGLIICGPSLLASAATPQTPQANAALRYLYAQVGSDGSIAASMGATEDTVISVADNGYDPATLKSPSTGTTTYHYLAGQASAITTAGGAAKYVLAWLAAGKPAAIDASAQLTKLNTPTTSGGYLEANGAFHNATTETANAYSQALAVLADLGAGLTATAAETGWLTCAQRSDGGFGGAIDDSAPTPPAAGCGDTHGSDTNDTSIVLQALGKAGIVSANSAAQAYLHGVQDADGGFPFNAGSGSDPDSDGLVIQALVATGQDPTGAAWTVGGKNALGNLESFGDTRTGGYTFPGNAGPDAFTTSAIPQALARQPYGAATTVVPGSSPPAQAASTPRPTSEVKSVSVPATGSGGDLGGASTGALALLALGSAALACAALRWPGSQAP